MLEKHVLLKPGDCVTVDYNVPQKMVTPGEGTY
jgi:mannose-6-phosphate isomerase-like protein (cupin superfamily)